MVFIVIVKDKSRDIMASIDIAIDYQITYGLRKKNNISKGFVKIKLGCLMFLFRLLNFHILTYSSTKLWLVALAVQ